LRENSRLRRADLDVLENFAGEHRPGLRASWKSEWFNALYAHRLTLMSRLSPSLVPFVFQTGPHPLPEDPTTPPQLYTEADRQLRLEESRGAYGKYLRRFELGGTCCRCLRELLICCRAEGVPAALLVLPEGPEFRSWYGPGADDQVWCWLHCLSRDFDVPLLDAHCWLNEDAFIDSHHLMPGAALPFTQQLGRELLLPLLRELVKHPPEETPSSVEPIPLQGGWAEEAEEGIPY
jgi:hypothetical protein